MNKKEMADELAEQTGMSAAAVDVVLSKAFKLMATKLADGEDITIAGFGTLNVRHRAARQGRNPQTQEPITIPASKGVGFKPAKALKDALNAD